MHGGCCCLSTPDNGRRIKKITQNQNSCSNNSNSNSFSINNKKNNNNSNNHKVCYDAASESCVQGQTCRKIMKCAAFSIIVIAFQLFFLSQSTLSLSSLCAVCALRIVAISHMASRNST